MPKANKAALMLDQTSYSPVKINLQTNEEGEVFGPFLAITRSVVSITRAWKALDV